MIRVHAQQDDDVAMIDVLERMARRSSEACGVHEYYVVRVRGWFSSKQFEFSGRELGAISLWCRRRQTFPPFVPGRVISQYSFERMPDGGWLATDREPIHRNQPSKDNLRRRMDTLLSVPTGFLWYGVDEYEPARLSLMCYLWTPEQVCNWYVSLVQQNQEWIDEKRVGIGRAEYEALVDAA